MSIRKRVRKPRHTDIFKPKSPKTTREKKADKIKRLRPLVRQQAWMLDGQRCVWPTCRCWVSLQAAHEHEVVWRSHGGDPTDLNIVVTTCAQCHHDLHAQVGGYRKRMEGSRRDGFRFWEKHQIGNEFGDVGEEWREVTR